MDEGTEKRGLHHDYTSWWSIYDFPTITLALSEYQLPGKEDDGQGRGKKKKLIPPQTGHSLFNYMSCRLIHNLLGKIFKSLRSLSLYSYLPSLFSTYSTLSSTELPEPH